MDDAMRTGRLGVASIASSTSAVAADIVGWSFSTTPGAARYVPTGHEGLVDPPNVNPVDLFARIGPVLADTAVQKVGHDLKFVTIASERQGTTLKGPLVDTMVLSYLLDATRSNHSIEGLALERTHYRATTEDDVLGKGAKALAMGAVPAASLATYASEHADLPLTMAPGLLEDVEREGLTAVYRELEEPLIPVLADIERAGIKVDTEALAVLGRKMQGELDDLCVRIYGHAGCEFNINSPKQLADVLFTKMSLQPTKRTGRTKEISTAREVLEELALVHEMPALVLRWREIQKLKGTYVDALPGLVNARTGRVHTTFNQAVAATGRLSSSDPNLQNIPIRTALGREIRAAFVAEPGHRPHFRRLLADRAAGPRASLRRRGADRGVSGRDRHSRPHGGARVRRPRRAAEARRARTAAARQDHQLRAALREDGLHAREGHRRDARRPRRSSSTRTSPAIPPCARSSIARSRRPARPESSAR